MTVETELCLSGGSSDSKATGSTVTADAVQDLANLCSAPPRTPSPRGVDYFTVCRQDSCRGASADPSLSNSSSYAQQQADVSGASLPSVPVLPPLQLDDVSSECARHPREALPETAAGASPYRQGSEVSLESLEAHSAFLKSSPLGGCMFDVPTLPEGHTGRQNMVDVLPAGDGGRCSELQDCSGGSAADAPDLAPGVDLAEEPDRWRSVLADMAALRAQVDELLQRPGHVFESPGQGRPASCQEAGAHGPSSLGSTVCSLRSPGPRGLGCAEPAPRPSQHYNPCRYAAPDVPRTEGSPEAAGQPQGTGEFADSLLDSLEERSLVVQARLREQARQVFARRCSLERWRGGSHDSGLRGGGGAAVRVGGLASWGMGSSAYSG